MTWFKVDDGFYDHPKVLETDISAIGLWTLAGSYCARHLTDGVITDRQVRAIGGTRKQAEKLVAAGLWSHDGSAPNGRRYFFKDWAEFQPSRGEVTAKRQADAERKRVAREKKRSASAQRSADERSTDAHGEFTERSRKGSRSADERSTDAHGDAAGYINGNSEIANDQQGREYVRADVRAESRDLTADASGRESALPDPTRPDPTIERSKDLSLKTRARREPKPLPDEWQPSPTHQVKARAMGVDLGFEADQFRNHALSVDRHQADWDAAFHTWLGKARPRAGPNVSFTDARMAQGMSMQAKYAALEGLQDQDQMNAFPPLTRGETA